MYSACCNRFAQEDREIAKYDLAQYVFLDVWFFCIECQFDFAKDYISQWIRYIVFLWLEWYFWSKEMFRMCRRYFTPTTAGSSPPQTSATKQDIFPFLGLGAFPQVDQQLYNQGGGDDQDDWKWNTICNTCAAGLSWFLLAWPASWLQPLPPTHINRCAVLRVVVMVVVVMSIDVLVMLVVIMSWSTFFVAEKPPSSGGGGGVVAPVPSLKRPRDQVTLYCCSYMLYFSVICMMIISESLWST